MSNTITISVTAGATLLKGTPVRWAAELDAKAHTGTGTGSIGVLLNDATSGSLTTVVTSGPVKVLCSDTNVKKFSKVLVDGSNDLKLHSGSNPVFGIALEDAYAADGNSTEGYILVSLFADKTNA